MEQDLIISRALCDLFGNEIIRDRIAFHGGTAIAAFGRVWRQLITRMPGEPWKSPSAAIATIRVKKIPTLLDGIEG